MNSLVSRPAVMSRAVPRSRRVRVCATHDRDRIPVFQSFKYCSISLWDVQDALIVCGKFKNMQEARDYCESMGVHYDNALKYYLVVHQLDTIYKESRKSVCADPRCLKPFNPSQDTDIHTDRDIDIDFD